MTIIIKNVRSEVVEAWVEKVEASSAITIKAIAIHWGLELVKKWRILNKLLLKGQNTCPFSDTCHNRSRSSVTRHWTKVVSIIEGYAKMVIDGVLGSTNKQLNWEVFH